MVRTPTLPIPQLSAQSGDEFTISGQFKKTATLIGDRWLPPRVCIQPPAVAATHNAGAIELKVAQGNTVYRQGEWFLLEPSRALRAYGIKL